MHVARRTATRKPYRRTVKRKPYRRTANRKPYRRTAIRKPYRRTAKRKPYRRTATRKPYRRTATRKPYRRTASRKPCRRTATRKPYRRTATRKPYRRTASRKPYRRTAYGSPTGVYQPLRTNRCKRHHATKTKQVADLRRPERSCTRLDLDWIFGRNRFRTCAHKVMNIKTAVLTSDHRLLSIDYRLRWQTRIKRMASAIDWSCIALPSAKTDLVTSTRQFPKMVSTSIQLCLPLPRSIAPTRVRSWNNNVELRSQVQRAYHKLDK